MSKEVEKYYVKRGEEVIDSLFDKGYFRDDVTRKELKALQEIMLGMKPKVGADKGYDGNSLESACDYYHRAFESWAEVIRFEDGYKSAISDWEQNIRGGFNNG